MREGPVKAMKKMGKSFPGIEKFAEGMGLASLNGEDKVDEESVVELEETNTVTTTV